METNLIIIFVFTVLLVWELYAPLRKDVNFEKRWPVNYLLSFILLVFGYSLSLFSTNLIENINLPSIDLSIHFPIVIEFFVIFLLLDFLLYILHRLSHYFITLWRFHSIHHSDRSFDVSTNFRHHPIEYLWVLGIVTIFAQLITINIEVFAWYSLAATIVQMWHHSNTKPPRWLEEKIAFVLITPSIHVVHHSIDYIESNKNLGTLFVFWDRLFKTYQVPNYNSPVTDVGVKGVLDDSQHTLKALLLEPFQKRTK